MRTFKTLYTLFFMLFLFSGEMQAQEKSSGTTFETNVSGVGTSAAAFLEIGVGARAMSMGGAYAAIANDATALYWNPAGTAFASRIQIELMHNQWLADTDFNFVGIVVPVPRFRSTLGFHLITLDYGSQPVRTVERPEGTGEIYDASDVSAALTFAMALTDRFAFGINTKYVHQRIWSETGNAIAFDLGVFYKTPLNGLQIGSSISNFGSEIQLTGRHLRTIVDPDKKVENFDRVPVNYNTNSFPLPLLFRFGVSYGRNFGKWGSMLTSMDLNHPSNTTESVSIGFEYGWKNMFFLRGGYENMFEKDAINGLTLGAGVDYIDLGDLGLRIDYAWSDWGILDNAQRFSLCVIF